MQILSYKTVFDKLCWCGFLLMFISGLPAFSAAQQPTIFSKTTQPNFVVVLVDDLGYTDVGCYGSTFYETPNIDRLAANGIRFTNGYAACPVCSPSRAAFMTGKYPARIGTTDYFGASQPDKLKKLHEGKPLLPARYQPYLDLEEVTIAETLRENGYKTFIAGKWHLGKGEKYKPQNQGFDINIGANSSGHPKTYFSPYANEDLKDGPPGEYLTDRLTSETVSFIEQNRNQPFFVYLPFYAVHTPLQPRPDLLEKYEAKRLALGLSDEFTSEGQTSVRMNQSLPTYAAMVEAVDLGVGRIVESLERLDLDNNTVVIFTSDNGGLSTKQGWPTSNRPLRAGKGWLYEGGVRVPLIVKWPTRIKPGAINHSVVTGTDFYPTILQMAGLPLMPEQHIDGKSMAVLLNDGAEVNSPRDIFWHYPHYGDQGGMPGSSIRSGDWKLIKWYEGNRLELFNLKVDPEEQKDLALKQPDKVKKLSAKLTSWLESMDAKYPTPVVPQAKH